MNKLSKSFAFMLVFLLSFTLMAQAAENKKIPVILDTDMVDWFDDGMGMALLVKAPNIDLIGVTTVIGNTWVERGTASAIRQLEGLGRTDIPVACGINQVTRKGRFANMSEEIRLFGRGGDAYLGAAGSPQPVSWQEAYRTNYKAEPTAEPIKESAVDFLIRNIKARPHELTIISIGTCSNMAAALEKAPEIAPLVKRIVYMGGAFFQQGNTTPAAEFNFWLNPEAARKTLRAPFPEQIIFGLDVCEKNRYTKEKYLKLKKFVKNRIFKELIATHWMTTLHEANIPFNNYIWDTIAVAFVIDPSIVTESRIYPVDVNDTYSPSYGQSLAFTGTGPEGSQKVRIVFAINKTKFWNIILNTAKAL